MENEIRLAAFDWLKGQLLYRGETLSRALLEQGFIYKGERVTLIGPSGIWKPRQFKSIPISITSTLKGPYDDSFSKNGLLMYRYRGTDPAHRDNIGLQEATHTRTPLIYFYSVIPGRYLPVWPVFILENHPAKLYCLVAVDPAYVFQQNLATPDELYDEKKDESILSIRKYVMAYTKQRLPQSSFREKVITAYNEHCALCTLRHRELLDAAHIIPDSEKLGEPIIQNGLSLCKIHHAAYDQDILGITPDYRIKTRDDILQETDGPMLRYGLQELHNKAIYLPKRKKQWPDPDRLEIRYSKFAKAL